MSESAQDRYDRSQVERHGGTSGDFTDQPPEPEPELPADYYPEPAEPFDDAADEEYADFEPATDDDVDQLDPTDPESIRGFIADTVAEELGDLEPEGYGAEAAFNEQAAAQGELAQLDAERALAAELPAQIQTALGHRFGSAEAAEMLAPAVAAHANAAAEELLTALVAEGMSRQAAIETLAPAYNTLLVSALQAERFERGNAQVLREAFRLGRR